MAITVSILQGGTNSHATSSEEVNFLQTDVLSQGVVGTITNTAGVAPMTGAFAINAQGTPDMTVAVSAGVVYVTATPTSGNSQLLRVKNSASSNVTVSANSTGGTRFDWLYVKIDPAKAKDPAVDASDVATLVTSRSTSASVDNGTPPTYGYPIAVITVTNGASSITNGNIADARSVTGSGVFAPAVNPYKFSAYRNAALNSPNAATATVVYDVELYDTNNNFSTSTGLYTAPINGFYRFTGTVQVTEAGGGTHRILIAIYKNGSELYRGTDFQNRATNNGDALNTIVSPPPIQLVAGDTIGISIFTSGVLAVGVGVAPIYTAFGGYLISKT
jgi:hypothetical protein